LLGDVSVVGASDQSGAGELILDGLLIEGVLTVMEGNLGAVSVRHCTLVPGVARVVVSASATDPEKQNAILNVTFEHSICGPVTLPGTVSHLRISDSIVSSGKDSDEHLAAITATGAEAGLDRTTCFGTVAVRSVEASNSIFSGVLEAAQGQTGCVRFSYLPLESKAPRRYCCRPEDATEAVPMRPQFSSRRYGDPGYAQLGRRCAVEIRQGADDEAELGAFHDLFQPQRETNLYVRLDEYLRFGLEAGIVYVS
jgi:hypothetical protein